MKISLNGYSFLSYFTEGYAVVNKGSKWGFIDKTGKPVFGGLKYDAADLFVKGFAIVQFEGRKFQIDKTGKELKD